METLPVLAGVKSSAADPSASKEGRTESSEQTSFNETFENATPDNNEERVAESVGESEPNASNSEQPKTELTELTEFTEFTEFTTTITAAGPISAKELPNTDYKTEQPKPEMQLRREVGNIGDPPSVFPNSSKDDPTRPQVNTHSVDGHPQFKEGQIEGSTYRLETNSNIEPTTKQIEISITRSNGTNQLEQQPHNKSHVPGTTLEGGVSVANTPPAHREGVLNATTQTIKTTAETVTEQSTPLVHKARSETGAGLSDLAKTEASGESDGVKPSRNISHSIVNNPTIQAPSSVEANQTTAFNETSQPTIPTELEKSSQRFEPAGERVTSSSVERSNGSNPNSFTLQNQRPVLTSIVEQLNLAVSKRTNGGLEIQLDPVELGKVRLQISPSELGQRIIVMADRPEILDLLRKNEDLLAFEFAEQGLENSNLQFEHHQTDENESDTSTEAKPIEPELWFEQASLGAGSDLSRLSGEAALDIRL